MTTYSDQQVNTALAALLANGGNVKQTAREQKLSEKTLSDWKNDTHRERYQRLEREYGEKLERETIELTRNNMQQAAEIEAELLERCRNTTDARIVPQALKAVADSRAKSVDKLIALTGRAPAEPEPDVWAALTGLAAAGFLRDPHGILSGNGKPTEPAPGASSEPQAGEDGDSGATSPPEAENAS